jgi:hypothetical protein
MLEITASALLSREPLYQFAYRFVTQCSQKLPFLPRPILPQYNPKASTDPVSWEMFRCLQGIVSLGRRVVQ